MKISDYINKAKRTLRPTYDLAGLALGMVGELGELLDAMDSKSKRDGIDELGDFLYYTALVMDSVSMFSDVDDDIEFGEYIGEGTYARTAIDMSRCVFLVAEAAKKHIYHGKSLEGSPFPLTCMLILLDIGTIAVSLGSDIDKVAERNIEKLSKRWGKE